ncbi:hypothetical protein [Bradyrhizobium sp. HKCCYLRH3061]|uniref:hypothetical protein n=1 Tax=Bradyrhizobium sp. HKCCYLRH3061 TaxID=3420734 RepID=UPI003EBB1992
MGTLYVGLNIFCPAAYRPTAPVRDAETYPHLAGKLFGVLQPALTTHPDTDPLPPQEYFRLEGRDLTSHRIVFVTDALDPTLVKKISDTAMPVPFPPGTTLGLSWKPNSASGARDIAWEIPTEQQDPAGGLNSPLLLPVSDWPSFAVVNFAVPPVRAYADLLNIDAGRLPGVQRDLKSWAVALATRVINLHRNDANSLTASEAAAYRLLSGLDAMLGTPTFPTPLTDGQIADYLSTPQTRGGPPIYGALWERAIQNPSPPNDPRPILPPRFLHDLNSLDVDPVRLLGLGSAARPPWAVSYHLKIWKELCAQITGTDDDQFRKALGRLYGFGERLRWPKAVAGSGNFMVLDPDGTRGAVRNWPCFGTNVQSLMGQVLELPFAMTADLSDASAVFRVQGESLEAIRAVRGLAADAATAAPQAATIARDADRPKGFFVYAPKMSETTPGRPPSGLPVAYAVPSGLLDAVDLSPRWSAPETGETLEAITGPRLGLRIDELARPALAGSTVDQRMVVPALLIQTPATLGGARGLFELVVGTQLHPDEKGEIETRFKALGSGRDAAGGQLWLTVTGPDGLEAWDLGGQVLDVAVADRNLRAVIVDRVLPAVRLADLVNRLSAPAPGGKNLIDQGAAVDLMLPVGSVPNPLFNRILGGLAALQAGGAERPPFCILKGAFTSRLSASTDRLIDRFELAYDPSPLHTASDVIAHLGDFNKLRLALSSDARDVATRASRLTVSGRVVTFLTYPDAAVPMPSTGYQTMTPPWKSAAPPQDSRCFGYFLSHLFTQDARGEERAGEAERLATESLRYINYLTPHLPWDLEGYVEHQYTQRIPIKGPKLMLPLATDIQSPATAALRADGQNVALMGWRFNSSLAAFELTFSRKYLKNALAPAENGEVRPTALRAIYEPLADLMAAIDRGAAELVLQRWAFEADGPRGGGASSPRDSGAITGSMAKVGVHKRALVAADAIAGFQVLRDLLRQPLSDFQTAIHGYANGTGDAWLTLSIPCPDGWSDLPSAAIVTDESDVLRLGLRLTRPVDAIVPGDIVDPARPEATPGFGMEVDKDAVAATYPELRGDAFADLHDAAALELARYLSLSVKTALRERFDWLRAIQPPPPSTPRLASPPPPTPADPEQIKDPRRLERLFGASLPFLFEPATARPAVARVVDLYYVPFAFRPLRPHPSIGDGETTLEFAEFLAEVVNDIASGATLRNIEVANLTPGDAFGLRNAVRSLLPDVADRMSALVAHVHSNATGIVTSPLFDHVDKLAAGLAADLSKALKGLLAATPGLFATTKGFGVAIFEPDAWSQRVHSLQLRKQIHPAADPGAPREDPSRFDVHQFPFPQFRKSKAADHYVIDVLDDARYDNEFEIDESVFDPPRPAWAAGGPGVVLGAHGARLRQRGDVQARSGEDVLEQRNRFDDGSTVARQIEADVVHWNPNWTEVDQANTRRFYLLPSRRCPATPIKLKPRAGAPNVRLPLDLRTPLRALNDQIAKLLNDRLQQNAVIAFGSADAGLQAKRRNPVLVGTIQPGADGLAGPGWWHVESYASEHYFVLEGDEDSSGPDGPFDNDRLRIEVEVGENPFVDEDPAPPEAYSVKGELGAWFGYQRLRVADPSGGVPKPGKIARDKLEAELRAWLTPPSADEGLLVAAPPVVAPVMLATRDKAAKVSVAIFTPGKPVAHRLANAAPQGIGSVLAAEIMDLDSDPKPKGRFVLRVIVLDEPWVYTRVRVRIERNKADVNDDGLPDINPLFQMVGDFSTWSSHGREPAVIDLRQRQASGLPTQVVNLTPGLNLDQFLAKGPGDPLDYGDLIGAAIDAKFVDPRVGPLPLWNQDRVRLGKYGITGMIVQQRPDLQPRYARAELTDQLEARTEEIPRVHLASFPADPGVSSRNFGPLLKGFTRADVPSPHHAVRVNWTNAAGEFLVSCTWPVRFLM